MRHSRVRERPSYALRLALGTSHLHCVLCAPSAVASPRLRRSCKQNQIRILPCLQYSGCWSLIFDTISCLYKETRCDEVSATRIGLSIEMP